MDRVSTAGIRRKRSWLATTLLSTALGAAAGPGIVTDGSLGAPARTIARANAGPGIYTIRQTDGSVAGNNLFYSFSKFNIDSGQTARFTTTNPALANVISRVTGGETSLIHGRLQLIPALGSAPALFLINPAGVVFGEGASISVPGAFHVSTADYLKFASGETFFVNPASPGSALSSAQPTAFGFLGTSLADISVADNAWLRAGQAQPVSVVAGNVEMSRYAGVYTDTGGDIRVVALGRSAQEVALSGEAPSASGNLTLADGGLIGTYSHTGRNGGAIVVASGDLAISNREGYYETGVLTYATPDGGKAGAIHVDARKVTIDGKGSGAPTGVISVADWFSTADGGNVEVAAAGNVSLLGGGEISTRSAPYSSGNSGHVKVSAGAIAIDGQGSAYSTGIFSLADWGSTGNAGSVETVARGNLSLRAGCEVSSGSLSVGRAGNVQVRGADISLDGRGGLLPTGIARLTQSTGEDNGQVEVVASGSLSMNGGAQIFSTTASGQSAKSGTLRIRANEVALDNRSHIYSTTSSSGDASLVDVSASAALLISRGSAISSSTGGAGRAGDIEIAAGRIAADGAETNSRTGIWSETLPGSTGNAGTISVASTGAVELIRGGQLSTSTLATGAAGALTLNANTMLVDGQSTSSVFTGVLALTKSGASGETGAVDVTVKQDLTVRSGGVILADTFTAANAGAVSVRAGNIHIDSAGKPGATGIFSQTHADGHAGSMDVSASGGITLDHGGLISTTTYGTGNAGRVKVSAGSLTIDRRDSEQGAAIAAWSLGSTGQAGDVEVSVTGDLTILHGGGILASTSSTGSAGSVVVRAGSLHVEGIGPYNTRSLISAAARQSSSGQTGFISITANEITLLDGGQISMRNEATVANPAQIRPTAITVTAPRISIRNSPDGISTSSSGNVAAGDIRIRAADRLYLDPSGITTTAQDGNGGSIDIRAGQLWLQDSQIATSVRGLAGNGGDISIDADTLILTTGFIQANTAAAGASGGRVSVSARNLIASGNSLLIGGDTPYVFQPGVFGYNVLQAAAPDGVSGSIQLATPALDITGSLLGLDTRLMHGVPLARRLCTTTSGSSLVAAGRGGLPPGADDFLSPSEVLGVGVPREPSAGGLRPALAGLPDTALTTCPASL